MTANSFGSLVRRFSLSVLATLTLLAATEAFAGVFEIGASGTYRRSNIDTYAYDESTSITGSIAYYLNEASAIELSYTDGRNKRVVSENQPTGHVTYLYYTTAGLDFVYTFGGRESAIRPYLKAGAIYIISKKLLDQYKYQDATFAAREREDAKGLAPSAGFGVRISLTNNWSLRLGVDAWSSRPLSTEPVTVDWFGRAGLSFLF